MQKYIMALDSGTTSNRAILFNERGEICSVSQREFRQYFPKPGWVEHDANRIWATQLGVAVEAMQKINITDNDLARLIHEFVDEFNNSTIVFHDIQQDLAEIPNNKEK